MIIQLFQSAFSTSLFIESTQYFEKLRHVIVSGRYLTELIFRVQTVRLRSLRPAMMFELPLILNGLFVKIISIKLEVVAVTRVGVFSNCVKPFVVKMSLVSLSSLSFR